MGYNILVADDSAITRKIVIKVIGMTGVEVDAVYEAGDGLEALEVLDTHRIDLVFADLNMPRMSGIELIEKLAEDHRLEDTPVIVITSDRNEVRLEELKKRGIRAYLNKPFRPEALREVMIRVLAEQGDKHGS